MMRLSRKRAVASACATDEEQLRDEGKHVVAEAPAASHADAAAAPNSAMTNTDLAISSSGVVAATKNFVEFDMQVWYRAVVFMTHACGGV